jgi:pyruvate dehydrogenase E1 component alpha subunit
VGALPAIAIVGAASPIAAGMAFAFKRHGTGQVACNFHGDGATNKGEWHEALNLAAVWSLPVIFLCENNLWGVSTHLSDVTLIERVTERAAAYRMPGVTIYGNDPLPVYAAISEAASRARRGDGPTLIESLTYRRGGHKRDDPATYRPQEEVQAWLEEDPIPVFRARLTGDPRFDEARVAAIEKAVTDELQEATTFAQNSPEPALAAALEDVYA